MRYFFLRSTTGLKPVFGHGIPLDHTFLPTKCDFIANDLFHTAALHTLRILPAFNLLQCLFTYLLPRLPVLPFRIDGKAFLQLQSVLQQPHIQQPFSDHTYASVHIFDLV